MRSRTSLRKSCLHHSKPARTPYDPIPEQVTAVTLVQHSGIAYSVRRPYSEDRTWAFQSAMQLKSLLLCSDDKIVRVLRRTLGDLEIGVEYCADAESALRHLSRGRFEAIIVDCAEAGAGDVLRAARSSPGNKRAIAVAILDPETGLRSAFDQGANFTLYKPVSAERARSSFRAARALMKRERRRNSRIPVSLALEMASVTSMTRIKANSTDLGEGGVAINLPKQTQPQGRWKVTFALPGSASPVEVLAEFAWQGTGAQVGLRFVDPTPELQHQLREWLSRNSPEGEQDDPPVRCQLTDLSYRACYLTLSTPFPISTRVSISMKAAGVSLRSEGVVRVMHAEKGMGVEFAQATNEQRASIEKFVGTLTNNPDALPELYVEPEGLETTPTAPAAGDENDPLMDLFSTHSTVTSEEFFSELRRRRGLTATATASA